MLTKTILTGYGKGRIMCGIYQDVLVVNTFYFLELLSTEPSIPVWLS
jgi:hypothetical protein